MKKGALITCHNIKNYGSVLQTYASIQVFEKFGYEVTVIDYQRPGTNDMEFRKKILGESRMAKKPILKYVFPLILKPSFEKMENVFSTFSKRHLVLSEKKYFSERELIQDCPDADIYISGSDQIWNSEINGRIERPYYLSFVPQGKTKISFASSFGVTELKEEDVEENKRLLSSYSWLSTREESGARIINNLGLNAVAILDPTLLIERKQWEELIEPIATPKKYILIYQLHNNKEMDLYVKQIQKIYKMPCLRIDLYYHYIIKAGKHVVCPTPGQVLSLIKNATYVISDSFHMTALSVIFEKQFVSIYSANSFNDRINNLLDWLNIKNRHMEDYNDFELLQQNIDYTEVEKKLSCRRSEVIKLIGDFLKSLEVSA